MCIRLKTAVRMGVVMSKETMDRIREAEAQADRLIADAEAQATRMKADAEAAGRERCREAEASAAETLKAMLEAAHKQADEQTAGTLDAAHREAESVAEKAERGRAAAERIVIGGLEAKCR